MDAIVTAMTLENQTLTIHAGSPINRADITAVLDRGPYDHVLLLSEKETFSANDADARTMLALLHVRNYLSAHGTTENIVAELVDPNDVELTAPAENSDFIVSQRLIGLLLAQLSESPDLAPVFQELFDSTGAVIAMHPVERYVAPGPTTFRAIIEAARDWGVTPIGVRSASLSEVSGVVGGGIKLNPAKDEPITLAEGDSIVVISA